MATITSKECSTFAVHVPSSDLALFRSMARRMGWETKKIAAASDKAARKPNATTMRAVQDVRSGKVFHTSSVEDLISQLNS